MTALQPVVLSGGTGTRLWPLSREAYPKQFLALVSARTLLQETLLRLQGMVPDILPPIIVCNEEHRFIVAEQLRLLGLHDATIVLEPLGRNTAPALTLAALEVPLEESDPILIAMPADHHVRDLDGFRAAARQGLALAEQGRLVTFGVVPTAPETGYGYIRRGVPLAAGGYALTAFAEKPDRDRALGYLQSGEFLWNSGIFMMPASLWLRAMELFRADIVEACARAQDAARRDGDFVHIDPAAFNECPSDSIDYAVMERVTAEQTPQGSFSAAVVPLDVGWSDVGSWAALCEVRSPDAEGNVLQGDAYANDTRNTLLFARHRLVAAVGVDDLVVVETPDAVLVVHKERTQEVKAVTAMLKAEGRTEHRFHTTLYRPWGSVQSVDEGHRFQVKRITVNPGAQLSRQMHYHRAEHWVVVRGTARVDREGESLLLTENQSTYIPLGTPHRLTNPGTIPLELIEVRSGSYLQEDDIVRFADDAGRPAGG